MRLLPCMSGVEASFGFPHPEQAVRRATPALCLARGRLPRVLLGRSSSLRTLRRRRTSIFVRALRRYYTIVRLPANVHVGRIVHHLLQPAHSLLLGIGRASRFSRMEFPNMQGSQTSQSPRDARFSHPSMLPSAIRTTSALCFRYISRLNTLPACVNASLPALRLRAHDSEPVWLARPSP